MTETTLDSITVKGFRSIASINELALRPINLLIGANGSGKSNFIGVFSFLRAVREGQLQDYVRRAGGAEQLLHFGSKVSKRIEMDISFGQPANRYLLELEPTDDDSVYPAEEIILLREEAPETRGTAISLRPRDKGREAGISNPDAEGQARWVRHRMGFWRVYHMHDTSSASPMRKTAQLNDNRFLRSDGSNLAAFLYLLREKHPESYGLVRRTVQRVAPFFDDFQLEPDPLNEETIRLAWRHKGSDQYFGASALSDGSLRFIVLATLLLQPKPLRPSVILVDEPELGLHPYAITLLASLVKQAAAESQIILSTQSTLLLDHFDPDDVLVAERVDGSTQLRRLELPRLEAWLEDYSLGQLWEKNELGGRPGPG